VSNWLITHDNCLDGATAALVGRACGLEVIFVEPDRVEDGLLQVPTDALAYLADVSIKPEAWPEWGKKIAQVLDHHQSALPLKDYAQAVIDQSRSGGRLMYDYAVQQGWLAASPAWERLCAEVARYDLWKPRHEYGQDLNRMFHHLGFGWYQERFSQGWSPFARDEADLLAHLIAEEAHFVQAHLKTAVRHQDELPFPIYGVVLESDGPVNIICHTLIERGGALVLVRKPDRRLSVRSDQRVDAARLMEALFHGGGHARAAGGRLADDDPDALPALLEQVSRYLASV
jgi:oligoribonuclease NrnB/cAMP/cGMP phosphodiesterase (DHH superfamily)